MKNQLSRSLVIRALYGVAATMLFVKAVDGGLALAQGISEGGVSYHVTAVKNPPFSSTVSMPMLVDIDGDGKPEQVYYDNDRFSLEAINPTTGQSLPGFPINVASLIPSNVLDPQLARSSSYISTREAPIAFGNLDGQPGAEIVLAVRGVHGVQFAQGVSALVRGMALLVVDGHGGILASRFDPLFEIDSQGPTIGEIARSPRIVVTGNPQYQSTYTYGGEAQIQVFDHLLNQTAAIDLGPDFPYGVGNRAVADIDNDGRDEILYGRSFGPNPTLEVRRLDSGAFVSGYPIPLLPGHQYYSTNFVLADIDGDGFRDALAVGTSAASAGQPTLHVFNRNGVLLPGWPAQQAASTSISRLSLLAAADTDGDGVAEPVLTLERAAWNQTYGNHARFETYVYDATGHVLPGWPAATITTNGATGRFALIVPDLLGNHTALPSLFLPYLAVGGGSASGCRLDIWSAHANPFFSQVLPFWSNNSAGCNSVQMSDVLNDRDVDLVLSQMQSLSVPTQSSYSDITFSSATTLDAPFPKVDSRLDWPVANADFGQTRSLPPSVIQAVPVVTPVPLTPTPTPIVVGTVPPGPRS